MQKLLAFLTKNLISVIGVTVLTGATVSTTALGMAKVANNLNTGSLKVPEIRQDIEEEEVSKSEGSSSVSSSIQSSSSSVSSISRDTDTRCIVTLFGNQYDVTSLKGNHSGGDIFTCGIDMTTDYQGKHGTNLNRMQQYLVTSGGTTSSSSSTNSSSSKKNDKRDDEEHEKDRDEERDEDHNEEEKERMESFMRNIIQLSIS
ncbi:hypothetical protein A2334_03645 [Candidatus Roizmanbacteria bacterium RIFOXYB2_FULL_38_10]|uniref:Cytochrome b5 heme-binding domain-containing protein n=1 Tax=Candidatus Roizmanbacteria bacterium RIFOXYD1_FULL_38_12 TaxID=1802093 RepID=A0A1F7L124_9BACT|nr:MAG: hypothetical protein A3K47_03200 [Candidatus Roizmanbacteria bacterium RIFOXYA2_FULL_38_14]OGK63773.1 MAG: hypothetical protein A3K27_03200 [Candidatus Roizmanbacteria bacterium RIFOXYA1_FULL_37_12]OGK65619.1 MAG: hypothetical protein A3K38_03200 [Candidatus Roizmanbacteria bacterium RIFOXYB1_FULL_40_23]OGK67493.1 MAG: hypothetical protein A2334_03645 [Candidatus Roizmanbacteria bacterium RIFOXYB2_FULL_38_10]OGK70024.1 MAG: hypothetical protein A3K21_03205 [Candidatus Roizmanbacteria ba